MKTRGKKYNSIPFPRPSLDLLARQANAERRVSRFSHFAGCQTRGGSLRRQAKRARASLVGSSSLSAVLDDVVLLLLHKNSAERLLLARSLSDR